MKYILLLLVCTCFFAPSFAQQVQDSIQLNEVVVKGSSQSAIRMRNSLNVTQVNRSFMRENLSGSLMQTLEHIPGVKAMSIGSGQSKPTIRGMGFNRLVVAENGIKHEGQQWGEDHGLEINQFAVDGVEVIKGPASLMYGSDAIGGVINLKNNSLPIERLEGEVELFTRTNNESIGISANLQGREKHFFYRANLTWIDYGDYKVPADSIQYYSYYFRLKDKRLRNTAGKERNGSITLGWQGEKYRTAFYIDNVYAKSGFFANAHGLEIRVSDIDYDHSSRDVDLPYHDVNHFKVANLTTVYLGNSRLEGRFAYQNNLRKEFAEAVSHGYMPIPPDNLERKFDKDTYSSAVDLHFSPAEAHEATVGISGEHQDNRRAGWGFIIPDFRTSSFGLFAYDRFHLTEKLILSAGLRFDRTTVKTEAYNDWFKTPVESEDSLYKKRSLALNRSFNSLTWSAGLNYTSGYWSFKGNIGKSYRAPIAKELSSDGINYHIFRYEKGESTLSSEESYQIDAGVNWDNGRIALLLEPYLNYFPNYIYLSPTPDYYEGLQMYQYVQNRVIRYGFEGTANYKLTNEIEAGVTTEYLYASQRSGDKKGYGLPFSPPWSTTFSLKYMPDKLGIGKNRYISMDYKVVGKQNRIVPPEKTTSGYQVLSAAVGCDFTLGKQLMQVNFQGQNLLNKRYYDHTGYYRLIEVPEPGRSFTLLIGMKF
ncbi:TonB-dependent receptor [Massilibacteroides sp.]|uniref:TonB-dependent receptor n=1 Tax=Massilibacteroides sp. TaxID=2034766 RepID=UPI0026046AD6|nr:TonB-dependent receptor [Massilibacteroides sp.]MDD4514689.1 TonB-dependent receptor [Massilibacteroides sp.]